jgi:hypothetical protein
MAVSTQQSAIQVRELATLFSISNEMVTAKLNLTDIFNFNFLER